MMKHRSRVRQSTINGEYGTAINLDLWPHDWLVSVAFSFELGLFLELRLHCCNGGYYCQNFLSMETYRQFVTTPLTSASILLCLKFSLNHKIILPFRSHCCS